MAFKMKRTPIRALKDFFKKATPETKAKRADVGGRAKKAGISTFEQNKIDRAKANRDKKRVAKTEKINKLAAEAPSLQPGKELSKLSLDGPGLSSNFKDPKAKLDLSSKRIMLTDEGVSVDNSSSGDDAGKADWSKAPKVGTMARTNWYKKYNFELDPTTPGYNSNKNTVGTNTFQGDPEKANFGATSRVPLTKKSPSKKRGYKMKRKK